MYMFYARLGRDKISRSLRRFLGWVSASFVTYFCLVKIAISQINMLSDVSRMAVQFKCLWARFET